MSPATTVTLLNPRPDTTARACCTAGSLKSTPTARPHHLRHDRQRADRATAAVDGPPPFLNTDPAESRPWQLRHLLRDAQEAPKILIGAVEDVPPDALRDRVDHARLLSRPRAG